MWFDEVGRHRASTAGSTRHRAAAVGSHSSQRPGSVQSFARRAAVWPRTVAGVGGPGSNREKRIPTKPQKPPLTQIEKFHILAASRATQDIAAAMGSAKKQTIDPRGWVRIGNAAEASFLRAAKRLSAHMDVGGTLRTYPRTDAVRRRKTRPVGGDHRLPDRFAHGSGQSASTRRSVAAEKRPIAPGKVRCPSPPWDTSFPGAFFLRIHRRCAYVCRVPAPTVNAVFPAFASR